jgi:hypothetical protein
MQRRSSKCDECGNFGVTRASECMGRTRHETARVQPACCNDTTSRLVDGDSFILGPLTSPRTLFLSLSRRFTFLFFPSIHYGESSFGVCWDVGISEWITITRHADESDEWDARMVD